MAVPRAARLVRSLRIGVCGAALACFAAAGGSAGAPPAARVILVSLDGGADWLIDRWMAEGKAPAFSKIAEEGAVAEAMIAVWPSLTAPAHATLWTGAPPRIHGIGGNRVPRLPSAEHTLLDQQSGYLSTATAAEPIWLTAARAGRQVLVLQASQGAPFTNQYPDRLLQFDVFGNELARMLLVEGSVAAGPHQFAIGEQPASLEAGPDASVYLIVGDQRARLSARDGARWSATMHARMGGKDGLFRAGLASYDSRSGAFVLIRGRVSDIASSHPAERAPFVAAAGTIMDHGLLSMYARGRFGRPLVQGGDGHAEDMFAEALSVNQEFMDGSLAYAAGKPWQLLVAYSANLDVIQHTLMGLMDPSSSAYTPDIASRMWPYLEKLFARSADQYLALMRRTFPDATIVVASDHGTEGTGRKFYPNAIFAQAGLLTLGPDGTIDLSRTKVVHLDGMGGTVAVNSVAWKAGIVSDGDRDAVKRAAARALLDARDPETGAHMVRAVFDAERDGEALGFGGPAVDLIFDPAPDYAPSAAVGGGAIADSSAPLGEGEHGPSPFRRKLHGIFFASGPGVRAGVRLPVISSVDVAPTVAALLGIPPPAQSVGRILPIQ
jgi:predicted AlkP superfamily phosphohydrolase/phosphomutase